MNRPRNDVKREKEFLVADELKVCGNRSIKLNEISKNESQSHSDISLEDVFFKKILSSKKLNPGINRLGRIFYHRQLIIANGKCRCYSHSARKTLCCEI